MKQKLFLIRHGDTKGTTEGYMYGGTDLPLTEVGFEQIRRLADMGLYPDPEGAVCYTTGLTRTEQTFDVIYGNLAREPFEQLREINMGELEMVPMEEALANPRYKHWLMAINRDEALDGGESINGFCRRIYDGFGELIQRNLEEENERIILVCHGGVIAFGMDHFFPDDEKSDWDWTPHPGGGFEVELEDGRPVAYRAFGDATLEGNMAKVVRKVKKEE